MQKLTLHLPKYRLQLFLKVIKRRKSTLDEALIPTKKELNLKYRVGGITRKFFRHIFEHKAVKKLLGTNIALMLVASSFVPTNTLGSVTNEEITKISGSETPIHTTVAIQNPVTKIKINQGYAFYHPGIDLDGETGDPIKPIKKGVVEYANSESFGYGKHIIINHEDGLKTLYAHLSKINVKAGDEITTNSVIGLMGSTGHSTGSHLHFEVRDHGIPINPLSILPR